MTILRFSRGFIVRRLLPLLAAAALLALPVRADPPRWVEHGSNGDIAFESVERDPPRRLVTRIADRSLPFGGTWTYELTPAGSGTRLRITEHGEVFNPVFRFMSRFVFGHTATIDRFLKDVVRGAN